MDNIDPNLLLGLLSNMNKSDTPSTDSSTNDLLMKFLLNGGLQKMMTPAKPKAPEPARTINLDDYVRVD